jgi:hypothetical protein
MNEAKRKRLEAAGWKVGTVGEFLELAPEESAMVEIKLALARELHERRRKKRLSQAYLALLACLRFSILDIQLYAPF